MIRFRILRVRVSVSIWFSALIFFLLLLGNRYTILCLLFAAAHEVGHMLPLMLCGGRIKELRLYLFRLEMSGYTDYNGIAVDYLSLLGGCIVNVVIAAILMFFGMREGALLSAAFATLNLLPVKGLDGGELLWRVIENKRGEAVARRISVSISYIFGAIILFMGLVFLLISGNPILAMTGLLLFVSSIMNN